MNEPRWTPRAQRIKRTRRHRRKQVKTIGRIVLGCLLAIMVAVFVWNAVSRLGGPDSITARIPALSSSGMGSTGQNPVPDPSAATEENEGQQAENGAGANQSRGGEETDSSAESDVTGGADSPASADPHESEEERVRLTFVGDVLLGSTVENLLTMHGYDYPYEQIQDVLSDTDVLAANLETPITDRGEPADKTYVYRSQPEVLPALREAGFDVVGLANNHILDYGLTGLEDTLHHLHEHGFATVGAGMNVDEAFAPAILEVNGIRIAYLAFSQVVPTVEWKATYEQGGVADTYALTRPLAEIEKASEEADLVVVLVHWGEERKEEPNERQQETAQAYIDAGADLVIGSHPHVLQSFQYYKGKWIAYSLGNFIFTTNDYPPTWESVVMQAECDRDGECGLELVPVSVKWAQPVPLQTPDKEALLDRLDDLSPGVDVIQDGHVYPSE